MKFDLVKHCCGCVLIFYLGLCGRGHVTFLFMVGLFCRVKLLLFCLETPAIIGASLRMLHQHFKDKDIFTIHGI